MKQKSYIASILSLYLAHDDTACSKISFMKDAVEHRTFEDISEQSDVLSQEKRETVFAYIFLYNKLVNPARELDDIMDCLKLPRAIKNNCEYLITEERINFIREDYAEKKKEYEELFNQPEEYICDLVTSIILLPIPDPKKVLTGLNPHSYEHSLDRMALEKLSVKAPLEKVLKLYSKYNMERLITIQYTGANIKVNKKNIPYLYDTFLEACQVLDMAEIPELYLMQGFIDACTVGTDRPIVILSNACLSLLTHDELLFVLGHELGHIKSKHLLYTMIAQCLPSIAKYLGNITLGLGDLAAQGLEVVLYDWMRKSEFSADRAGLLVCQNVDAAISTMAKLAGYPPQFYENINSQDFLEQAKEFNRLDQNSFDSMVKILSALYDDHPWTVMRAYELNQWVESGGYNRIFEQKHFGFESGEKKRNCSACGTACNLEAKFCINCGRAL